MLLRGRLARFAGDMPKMSPLALLELGDAAGALGPGDDDRPGRGALDRAQGRASGTARRWRPGSGATCALPRRAQFARLVPNGAWAAEAAQVSYLWFLDALRCGEGLASLMASRAACWR